MIFLLRDPGCFPPRCPAAQRAARTPDIVTVTRTPNHSETAEWFPSFVTLAVSPPRCPAAQRAARTPDIVTVTRTPNHSETVIESRFIVLCPALAWACCHNDQSAITRDACHRTGAPIAEFTQDRRSPIN